MNKEKLECLKFFRNRSFSIKEFGDMLNFREPEVQEMLEWLYKHGYLHREVLRSYAPYNITEKGNRELELAEQKEAKKIEKQKRKEENKLKFEREQYERQYQEELDRAAYEKKYFIKERAIAKATRDHIRAERRRDREYEREWQEKQKERAKEEKEKEKVQKQLIEMKEQQKLSKGQLIAKMNQISEQEKKEKTKEFNEDIVSRY